MFCLIPYLALLNFVKGSLGTPEGMLWSDSCYSDYCLNTCCFAALRSAHNGITHKVTGFILQLTSNLNHLSTRLSLAGQFSVL